MKKFIGLLVGSFALLLTGCTTRAHLGYTPIYPQQPPNHIRLVVKPFDDYRSSVDEIGSNRNIYGMPIIKVKTGDSVPKWVMDALKAELANAGYTIEEKVQSTDYEIEGKIHRVYASSYFIYHGRMHIEIALKKNEKILFQKEYLTRENGGLNWIASPAVCVNTIESNLQKVCQHFIEDLSNFLQQDY